MERVMSVEERIKRAEDIYNKRNGIQYTKSKNSKGKHKENVKRLFMQIFVFLLIYIVFYTAKNREYIFSEDFRNEVDNFFNEKTKISEWYSNAKGYFTDKLNFNNNIENTESDSAVQKENNTENPDDSNDNIIKDNDKSNSNDNSKDAEVNNGENIGGAYESEELSEQKKMENDAKEIKRKISFIVPLKGTISSTFGWRNPTTSTVPRYHTGLDIAATEGTKIKSATDGTIILASSDGDYGKHYQVQIDDIIIIYAHCKKLYLKEGDKVKQGQEIAEVGTTGNSTGPHLHFEIRKGEEKIDPQLILNI